MTRDLETALRQALAALESQQPANDTEPVIDERAIRERAQRAADRMRRARNR